MSVLQECLFAEDVKLSKKCLIFVRDLQKDHLQVSLKSFYYLKVILSY